MKIKVVSSKDEINTIDNEEIIHLAFRPSNKDVFMLVQRCKILKAIHIPRSYMKTISNSILMFLEMNDIKLLEGDEGTSKDEITSKLAVKTRRPST
jgi:hypothetical protein